MIRKRVNKLDDITSKLDRILSVIAPRNVQHTEESVNYASCADPDNTSLIIENKRKVCELIAGAQIDDDIKLRINYSNTIDSVMYWIESQASLTEQFELDYQMSDEHYYFYNRLNRFGMLIVHRTKYHSMRRKQLRKLMKQYGGWK